MKFNLAWLRELVPVPEDLDALAHDLSMLGLPVEAVEPVGGETVLDVEVTSNRPDCLGHLGLAREIAARYDRPLTPPEAPVVAGPPPAPYPVPITIAAADLCPRYSGMLVRGVTVGPSPDWLARRLESVGVRPINNVVDVTNYVLLELGHPLHAFDQARLAGPRIIVRRAQPGERIRTLDGVERRLTVDDLVIADDARPVALAGVMGGEESGVTETTTDLLLEGAVFDARSIRRTAVSQGMKTDASFRFERGVDSEITVPALHRVRHLLTTCGAGGEAAPVEDVVAGERAAVRVPLRHARTVALLGEAVTEERAAAILSRLGFTAGERQGEAVEYAVPSHRLDVSREVDLIEEVGRIVGYDRIPVTPHPLPPVAVPAALRRRQRARRLVLESLVGAGGQEFRTWSFIEPEEAAPALSGAGEPVALRNPIVANQSVLRSTLVPGLLRAAHYNLNRGNRRLRGFEIGTAFFPAAEPGAPPEEREHLALLGTGPAAAAHWRGQPEAVDLFHLTGLLTGVTEALAAPPLAFVPATVWWAAAGTAVAVQLEGAAIGHAGRVAEEWSRRFDLIQPVWLAEVHLAPLLDHRRPATYRALVRYPWVERDLSLLVDRDLPYREIEDRLRGLKLERLQTVQCTDLYEGRGVPEGKRSFTLHCRFQARDRTLTQEEVEADIRTMVERLQQDLGVQLRS